MRQLTVVQTFLSRFLILILSFALVVFSTNIWGSEGKGIISLVIANSAIIGFFSSIFAGSSISYFSSRYKTEKVLLIAYLWSVIVGIVLPLIFSLVYADNTYLFPLIGISVSFSLLSANINLFVGKQDIKKYNFYSVAQQVVHIFFIFLLFYIFDFKSLDIYFYAQIACFGILFLLSTYQLVKNCSFSEFSFSKEVISVMFHYGWKSQLSAFVQFLNYRLSFYFLEFYAGISYVGIFSIGVTFSEAIWTVSRSLAVILYADIVNTKTEDDRITKTKDSLKITFWITLLFLIGILSVPGEWYTFVFGSDFYNTKDIIILLSPGILAIAVSNIVGFYFSGTNQLKILNIKSILGLVCTVCLAIYAVPRWGIYGACVVTTLSYCLSSGVLFRKFYHLTRFRISDYMISKSDIMLVMNKFAKK